MQLKNNISKLFLGALTLISQSCSNPKETAKETKFEVTDSLISKLLVDTVQQGKGKNELNFSAKIAADEERKSEIFPMVGGTVFSVPVKLGDKITKGQVLAVVNSAEMAVYDKDAISAAAELNTAERNVKQAQDLFNSGLASARELKEAQNEFRIKQAEDKRAKATLKLNGGNKNGVYTITSPLTGIVIEKRINTGMQLRPDHDNSLFTIADLSSVSAIINIYESDISNIKEGDAVNIAILSYPDRTFKGKIDQIYNILDDDSKVMKARVRIANADHLLKPGMMAMVNVSASSGTDLPYVNSRGIIFDENRNYVVVLDPVKKVRIQEIEISRKNGEKAYISKGLKAGDRILASKQVFLYESIK